MRVLHGLVVICSAFSLLCGPARGQAGQDDVGKATELVKAGKPDEALALVNPIIEAALQDEAKDPKAICPGVAIAVLQQFMGGKATVSIANDWCEAMLIKAYALNELKRPNEAEQLLATLVGHDPENPQYLTEYAYTVRTNGRLEQALTLYKQADTLAAKRRGGAGARWRAAALRGQGYVYIEMQRWDEATKAYQRSLKFEPGNEIALHELGFIKEQRPR